MRAHGIRRALAAVVAYAVSALTLDVPRIPATTKFNEHPFAKRHYGKVVDGGHGTLDAIRGMARGALGLLNTLLGVIRPAAAFAALLAVMLALDAVVGASEMILAVAPAFSSRSLRDAKSALVAKSRKTIEDAEASERKVEETAGVTQDQKDQARADTDRAKTEARGYLVSATDLDADIALAEQQEQLEAQLGRSQGRLAGGPDADPGQAGAGADGQPSGIDQELRALEGSELESVTQRYAIALAAGKGSVERTLAYAEKHFGSEDLAFRALSSSSIEEGGAIVPEPLSASIVELLRPRSAVRRLNPVLVPLTNGKLSLPKMTGGAVAGYIGENDNAPKTEQRFGNVVLVFRKLAALVPISNDLLRYAPGQTTSLLRDDLTSALVDASDPKFIRGTGTEHAPKGLRNWAPAGNLIAANGTVNLANVTDDLSALILALEEANVRMIRPGWIFAPRTKKYLMTVRDGNGNYAFRDEMLKGTLWDWPFSVTNNVPRNLGGGGDESEVTLADFADVVIGEAPNIGLAASDTAAYHDGTEVQAAFSRDQTVLRAIQEHDLVMRHDESVAVLTAVKWGA